MINDFPRMESVKTTAKLTGLSEDAIRRMIHDGRITFIVVGRKYLINVDRLVDFLNGKQCDPDDGCTQG